MMKILKILISILTLVLFGCSESFQELDFTYSKDKNFVYKNGEKIIDADPDSFQMLNADYSKDKNHTFYLTDKIDGADVATFKADAWINEDGRFDITKIYIAEDQNHIYKYGKIAISKNKSEGEYKELTYEYGKDDKYGYFENKIIEESDGKTFVTFGESHYAKDKNAAYYNGEKNEGADGKTFIIIELTHETYARDKNAIYFKGEKIENADISTFKIGGTVERGSYSYAKDKNNVYYEGKILSIADAKTFKDLPEEYAIDKKYVYYWGKIVGDADSSSFKYLNYWYAKDKNFVYYHGNKITIYSDLEENITSDGNTFEVLDNSGYGYARDKNFGYCDGKILRGSDGKTLKFLGNNIAKDSKHKYERCEIIE